MAPSRFHFRPRRRRRSCVGMSSATKTGHHHHHGHHHHRHHHHDSKKHHDHGHAHDKARGKAEKDLRAAAVVSADPVGASRYVARVSRPHARSYSFAKGTCGFFTRRSIVFHKSTRPETGHSGATALAESREARERRLRGEVCVSRSRRGRKALVAGSRLDWPFLNSLRFSNRPRFASNWPCRLGRTGSSAT